MTKLPTLIIKYCDITVPQNLKYWILPPAGNPQGAVWRRAEFWGTVTSFLSVLVHTAYYWNVKNEVMKMK